MKFTIFHVVTTAATFLSLYASADAACSSSGGGGNRPYPNSPYPTQYSTPYGSPVTQNLATPAPPVTAVTPTAPVARLTVVPATGNLQLASPVKSEDKSASTPSTDKPADLTASTKPAPPVTTPAPAVTPEPSKIADAIKGLVGTWLAVSRQSNGELSTVELQLDDHGWAKLTVPGADGKPSTTTRKVEFENSELKLTGADADVMLGKLVEFNARQMVLERSGGQVTFVRP
jgi:hypothetical protein